MHNPIPSIHGIEMALGCLTNPFPWFSSNFLSFSEAKHSRRCPRTSNGPNGSLSKLKAFISFDSRGFIANQQWNTSRWIQVIRRFNHIFRRIYVFRGFSGKQASFPSYYWRWQYPRKRVGEEKSKIIRWIWILKHVRAIEMSEVKYLNVRTIVSRWNMHVSLYWWIRKCWCVPNR